MSIKFNRPVSDLVIHVPSVASTAYTKGDLLYLNTGVATKASSQADGGTLSGNQATFADNFLGVCMGNKLATDATTREIPVAMEGEFEADCASTTWAVGEFVAAVEASNGTELENQVVAKTSTRADAIGVCVKAGTSITKVRFLLFSRFNKPLTQGT